jgi:translation initiation factor IF-3
LHGLHLDFVVVLVDAGPELDLLDLDGLLPLGQNRGVMGFFEALQVAEEAGLDLVEIAPNSVPPVILTS